MWGKKGGGGGRGLVAPPSFTVGERDPVIRICPGLQAFAFENVLWTLTSSGISFLDGHGGAEEKGGNREAG